ncbi:MAG: M6 family metalloprotease domain-containing protein [Prevotella sp.]|nr:M6 family metalloprotease domain-containing protein [Prevotella sp.]
MTTKFQCIILFLLTSVAVMAVPVRRGQWITVTLTDGSVVTVEACGDEHAHYWQSADGQRYLKDEATGAFRAWQESDAKRIASKRSQVSQLRQRKTSARRASAESLYKGQRKGLIILVQFSDRKFKSADPAAFFNSVANEQGFSQQGFKSSVKDYFRAQSGGAFEIDFDVVGPVTMPNGYAYYGGNNDYKVGEMIHDACVGADSTVDFSNYDWDKDGEAEEVYVLYAGYGEADNTSVTNYIWPHMYALSAYDYYKGTTLRLDNTVIDVYACSNELGSDANYNGIGTICHEFSHCLGLPDMYDTSANGVNFGMGSWDLMDYGSYNDDGNTPASYTGYERMVIGWSTPIELTGDTTVTDLKPVSEMGQSYIIYNQGNRNEYYILDNRQLTGYDTALPASGMIISHIDYDEDIWYANIVNATGYDSYSGISNTHQRSTIFHADNDDDFYTQEGDAFPFLGNDSLTARSNPSTLLYNANTDGTYNLGFGLWGITQNGDGTMSFRFAADTPADDGGDDTDLITPNGTVLLSETFDNCAGTGGNDGRYSGSIANASFKPDLNGWRTVSAYGGDKCARFGTLTAGNGVVISPKFTLPGDTVTLSFRAAGWDAQGDGTNLTLSLSTTAAKFVDSGSPDLRLTMTKGAWTIYTVKIVGKGNVTLTFTPSKRFFLDDVTVQAKQSATSATGIAEIQSPPSVQGGGKGIYTISGQYVGTDLQTLPHGIYIVDGKKVVK